MNMMTICQSIGEVLYEKGVIGHITVDLVSFPDPTSPSSHPLFWAVDLNCNLSDYSAACSFFDFLMDGKLDTLTGKYTVHNPNKSVMGSTQDGSRMDYGEEGESTYSTPSKGSNPNLSTNRGRSPEHRRDFSDQRSFMYCKYLHHPGISKI